MNELNGTEKEELINYFNNFFEDEDLPVGDKFFGDFEDFRMLLDDLSPEMKQQLANELIRLEIYEP